MPTYNELVELSKDELMKRTALALHEIDKAEEEGNSTSEKARIYHVYKNELAKRKYDQRAPITMTTIRP
jgi:hypothetical protein